MGRDLTLYPQKASKTELKKYIESLGFHQCNHLWDWPDGTLNYFWFDNDDYKSIDGVSVDIYPVDKAENTYTDNDWALHVRNLYSASIFDVKMLNTVLRGARKLFGGTITGDYGTNRYAPLWEDNSTPMSRGIYSVYQKITNSLRALKFTLPDEIMDKHYNERNANKKDVELFKIIEKHDPTRILYNGLIPFLISIIEYYFSDVFIILLKYDEKAKNKIKNYNQKIDFQLLIKIKYDNITPEKIIANNYTFQNLDQVAKAYKDWVDIDIKKILFTKKRIGNKIKILESRLVELIQYRHQVVHHFFIDRNLNKNDFIELTDIIEKTIEEITKYIEKKYDFKIERY
jgi:hypothetical protein